MIERIFIANRGEIAQRIARTAKEMGLEAVCCIGRAVAPAFLRPWVSDFVQVSDESAALYLDQERMISLAKQSRCDALHPGFGFLSENAEFSAKVVAAGLTWIGPDAATIQLMADKDRARTLAQEVEVPCTRGMGGIDDLGPDTKEKAKRFSEEVGLPLLVKASMGGGGKGMRIVRNQNELIPAMERARSEAFNSFGCASLILEQFIETSRHVEVQILGDRVNEIAILGDRDCSLQRRHQKILEEAPAPFLHDDTRQLLHACAKRLAEKVGYRSAGTVEFMLAEDHKTGTQQIYFLEVNTRLQVEHTVTEQVFGLDLVAAQIRIANGELLDTILDDQQRLPRGHSFEARLYCEDPKQDFFPSPGPVFSFSPFNCPGVRWELGIDGYDEISGAFDPMFAKVIATAESRVQAAALLERAIAQTVFFGPRNNKEFLCAVLQVIDFKSEVIDTDFIERNSQRLDEFNQQQRAKWEQISEFAFELLMSALNRQSESTALLEPASDLQTLTRAAFADVKTVGCNPSGGYSLAGLSRYWVKTPGFSVSKMVFGAASLESQGGQSIELEYACVDQLVSRRWFLQMNGVNFSKDEQAELGIVGGVENERDSGVSAQLPGKVVTVVCELGQIVEGGDVLFVLESMKMEFEVKANVAGRIDSLLVSVGDQVEAGQALAELEPK